MPLTSDVNKSQLASIESLIASHAAHGDKISLQVYVKYEGAGQIPSELSYYVCKRDASGLHQLEKRLLGREARLRALAGDLELQSPAMDEGQAC